MKELVFYNYNDSSKGWKFGIQWMLGQDLQDSTIGIVGLGGIGQATAKRFQAFEVSRIIYSGNSEKPEGTLSHPFTQPAFT